MKKFMILIVILSLFFPTCSNKKEEVVLKKGTSTYELAKDLSQIVETLDPDINKVLVSSQNFNLTTGEIIQFMEENLGSKAEQLKQMNAENLKQYVQRNASVLADRKLLLAEARDSDVSITKQEVDQVVNAQAEKAGGMDKFREILNSNGITLEIFRGNIQKEMLVQSFLDQKIGSEVTVTDEEILSAYNSPKTVTVRHILLLTQDKEEAEKKAVLEKMKQIQKRAQAGEDFAELAKEFSEDPGSQEKGGLYENIERGVMVKPFEEAAFNVPVGEISDIVETQYGYHIIKVEERQMEERPLDQVRDEIRQNIRQTRIEQEFSRYMDELRSQANIQSFEL
ncbi:MAG: peptidylprolyl isomerase [Candidatus Aminicenantes bacterium]